MSMLNGTMKAARHMVESATEGAENAYDNARDGTSRGFQAAIGLVHLLRSLDGDDVLGWVGLQRRSSIRTWVVLGAGIAVGAGVGVLLAPTSGEELRRNILARLKGLQEDTKAAADKLGADVKQGVADVKQGVKDAEKKVENLAVKAGDKLKEAEKAIERKAAVPKDAEGDFGPALAKSMPSHTPARNGHN